MSDKPYYEQEYHAPESDIPDPSLFLYPFTWAARSTRKAFWVAFVIQFLLTIVIGVISVAVFIPNGVLSVSRNDMSWVLTHISFGVWLIELILFILLVWIKLGLLGYAVRRLHDANYSGWWLWLPTVEEPVRWGSYLFVD